jgi:hypothetical protein
VRRREKGGRVRGFSLLSGSRRRKALFFLALFAAAVGLSFIWEGPRTVYTHAIVICLDCLGLI